MYLTAKVRKIYSTYIQTANSYVIVGLQINWSIRLQVFVFNIPDMSSECVYAPVVSCVLHGNEQTIRWMQKHGFRVIED